MVQPSIRKRGRRGSPESWSVDTHVGQRVRIRRTILGMSQEKLGEAIGLTFQQVQKYERGANRISAGTLYRLSQVLNIPVSYFFDGYEDSHSSENSENLALLAAADPMALTRREARLLRLWREAPPQISGEILSLLGTISNDLADDGSEEYLSAEPGFSNDLMVRPKTIAAERPKAIPPSVEPASEGEVEYRVADSRSSDKAARPQPKTRARRRPGAVWDPSDIYRSGKS